MGAVGRVAARWVAKQGGFDLAQWKLEGLTQGKPVVLYHGTTRTFTAFSLSQSRDELVNEFYGRGIFLTPSKRVAEKYAEANRNIGFDPSIIADLKRKNPGAGQFLQELFEKGQPAFERADGDWAAFEKELGGGEPGHPLGHLGVDHREQGPEGAKQRAGQHLQHVQRCP